MTEGKHTKFLVEAVEVESETGWFIMEEVEEQKGGQHTKFLPCALFSIKMME